MATEVNATTANIYDGSRRFGPFKSSGNNFYGLGVFRETPPYTRVTCHKASDPNSSWSEQDSADQPNSERSGLQMGTTSPAYCLDSEVFGQKIRGVYVIKSASYSDGALIFFSFDMSTDAWEAVDGTDTEYFIFSIDADSDALPTIARAVINHRTDGDVIVAYNGARTATKGTRYDRVRYARREGSTWTVDIAVGAGTNQDEILHGMATASDDDTFIAYKQGSTASWKKLTGANALDGSASSSSFQMSNAAVVAHSNTPIATDTAGECLIVGVIGNGNTEHAVEEYLTGSNYYTSSLGATNGYIWSVNSAAAWDSASGLVYILGCRDTGNRLLRTYNPSTNAFAHFDEITASDDEADVNYSLLVDGTTLRYFFTDSANDIWYEEYSISTTPEASGSLTNVGQALSGSAEVFVEVSGSLVNNPQILAGLAEAFAEAAGALVNNPQALAGSAQLILPSATGALTNTPQSLAGSAEVLVTASGSLSNIGQILAGIANVLVEASGGLSNEPQSIAGTASTFALEGAGGLVNVPQGLSGAASATQPSASGSLANNPQVLSGAATGAVPTANGALSNNPQSIAGAASATQPSATGSLVNNPQALSGAATGTAITASGALSNNPQAIGGTANVLVEASGGLLNIGQILAAIAEVLVTGSGGLSNEPQSIAGSASSGLSGSGGLANQPQAISGAGTVAVDASGSLVNIGQGLAGLGDVAVTGAGGLSNTPQSISGSASSAEITAGGGLSNSPQSLAGLAEVAISAIGSLVNSPQAISGIGSVSESALLEWNDVLRSLLLKWNDTAIGDIDSYNEM